ncbi:MAG: pitrilysin family protein [Pseudomonadota bacterium]
MMRIAFRIAALWLIVLWSVPARAEIDVQVLTSPDGHPFWLVQEMSIPIVAVEISLPTGAWMDPEGKEGVAGFAMGLMDEGSGELDAVAFAERRSDLAARFGFSAGAETSSISARFLIETLDESAALLALAMTQPRFDAAAVERVRSQVLSGIAQSQKSPNAIASRTWYSQAFPGHPYGRSSRGTPETVNAITIDDLRDAHRRLLITAGVHVAIVGALTPEGAGNLVDRLLAGLPEGEARRIPLAGTAPPPGVTVVEQDVPQSVALFGHAGIDPDDPEFLAAAVANHILGSGSFSARLTEEIRVKRGLAYSVSSSLTTGNGAHVVIGSVQTANARMAESIEVIRTEWEKMAAGDISQEDVDAAKTYLTGSFPLSFDTNAKIAGYLVWAMGRGFDSDYVNQRNVRIEALTLADVQRAARRLYQPDALSIVIVGQPDGL